MGEFSRQYRLTGKQNFQSVFANGLKIKRKYLLLLYQPNQKAHARLGIMINKHHVKLAVVRNRLRRIIRESFRCHDAACLGFDLILLIRSDCNKLENAVLRNDIHSIWQNLITLSPQALLD